MNPNDPIQAQARQALQSAQQAPIGGGQPQGQPQAPQGGLPVPPPQIAMQMAHIALSLDPMVLGTLIWRALKEHGESLNQQGIQDLASGQPSDLPQGMPQGMMGQ